MTHDIEWHLFIFFIFDEDASIYVSFSGCWVLNVIGLSSMIREV